MGSHVLLRHESCFGSGEDSISYSLVNDLKIRWIVDELHV